MRLMAVGDRVRSRLVPDRGASSVGVIDQVSPSGRGVRVHWDDNTYTICSVNEVEPLLRVVDTRPTEGRA